MSDPDTVEQNLIIPNNQAAPYTGALGSNEAVYINAYVDGEMKQVPVFTEIRQPAIIDSASEMVSKAYNDQLCIYVVDENGYYHIRSLGYARDEYNSYSGLECDDASILSSDNEKDMFIQTNAQMTSSVQRINGSELYLGSREKVDSVLANENSKIIIKYNLADSGTTEYVTFEYNSLIHRSLSRGGHANLGLSFPFDRMTYLLSNDVDSNKREDLVVIYGEITQYDDSGYDLEFNGNASGSPSGTSKNFSAKGYTVRQCSSVVEKNGTVKYEGLYDHGIQFDNVMNLDASCFNRLRIRMKTDAEIPEGEVASFYFKRNGETAFTENRSYSLRFQECAGVDSDGWLIFDVDLSNVSMWQGTITGFRFDPTNIAGTYEVDYIRFLRGTTYNYDPVTPEELKANGYTENRILMDENYENGFDVRPIINNYNEIGHFEYTGSGDDSNNLWAICPWWTHNSDGLKPEEATNCIWNNRDTTLGEYTIGDDKGTTRLSVNPNDPEGTVVSFTLNGSKIYNGTPHYKDDASTPNINEENRKWWPHLLIEQDVSICPIDDPERTSAGAERIFVEYDIRMPSYTPSPVEEGTNRCQFLAYFYLRPKDEWPKTKNRIWFGLGLFDDHGGISQTQTWAPDSAAHQYIYCIPGETIYEGMENSYYEMVKDAEDTVSSNEWRHFCVDITPHIERAVEWINRDNGFGKEVTKDDLFFDGVNIGFEIHGNVDCTFEIRNFNMVSYN